MQIEHLHKNIYKLYALVLPEESKSEFIKEAEKLVEHWEILHKQRVSDEIKQKVVGMSITIKSISEDSLPISYLMN